MKKPKKMETLKYTTAKLAFVILLFIAATLESVAQNTGKKQVVDKIVAKVDNYIALKSELELSYLEMNEKGRQFNQSVDRCEVLQQLLQNKLMLAKAEIDSITVTEEAVSFELDQRMRIMVSRLGTEEELERYYNKSLNLIKEDLRDRVREQVLVKEVSRQITKDVKVTPAEVKRFFNAIHPDSLPFFSTEVTVGHIVKMPVVSKEQKDVVRDRLNEIRSQIISGEVTFAEMAKKHSEDPGSAENGGELGFFKRGELAPEFEATAMRMKAGDISRPVETKFGFHIIQLIERRGNSYSSRHILMRPNSSEDDIKAAERYLDSLRTEIVSGKIEFSKAAKEYSDDQMTQSSGGYFLNQEESNLIAVQQLDPSVFFVIDTMKVGSVSKPLAYRTEDGKDAVRIVYYKSRVRPHQANLKDDYQKIQAATINEKQNKIIEEWFKKAVNDVFIDIDEDYEYCNLVGNRRTQ